MTPSETDTGEAARIRERLARLDAERAELERRLAELARPRLPAFIRLFWGLTGPKEGRQILGMDFAGRVESVGKQVTRFSKGDLVFGVAPLRFGAHAEYMVVAANSPVDHLPSSVAPEQAVIVEGFWYANNALKHMVLGGGKKLLVYGGSGAIGSAAIQLAKYCGAQITAVVHSQHRELALSLGADSVCCYDTEDFLATDDRYDYLFDAVDKLNWFRSKRLLKPSGTYVCMDMGPFALNLWLSIGSRLLRNKRFVFALPSGGGKFVGFLKERLAAGEVGGVFDRQYPLEEIIDAYRYVETGQKVGIVRLKISDS